MRDYNWVIVKEFEILSRKLYEFTQFTLTLSTDVRQDISSENRKNCEISWETQKMKMRKNSYEWNTIAIALIFTCFLFIVCCDFIHHSSLSSFISNKYNFFPLDWFHNIFN